MFDRLMRMKWTVKHVEFFFQDCKVPSIRTVLNVQDWVLMVFDLLDHAGVFDVEDPQHS